MNWHLLFFLVVGYTALFFLLVVAARPGMKYLGDRFQEQFALPVSEDAIKALSPEQRAIWDHIYLHEYSRTPYRWIEVLIALFHYPSIIVLGALLKRPTLDPAPMYFITGTTYVAILYFVLR